MLGILGHLLRLDAWAGAVVDAQVGMLQPAKGPHAVKARFQRCLQNMLPEGSGKGGLACIARQNMDDSRTTRMARIEADISKSPEPHPRSPPRPWQAVMVLMVMATRVAAVVTAAAVAVGGAHAQREKGRLHWAARLEQPGCLVPGRQAASVHAT